MKEIMEIFALLSRAISMLAVAVAVCYLIYKIEKSDKDDKDVFRF